MNAIIRELQITDTRIDKFKEALKEKTIQRKFTDIHKIIVLSLEPYIVKITAYDSTTFRIC